MKAQSFPLLLPLVRTGATCVVAVVLMSGYGAARPATAQRPELAVLLARAADYVDRYVETMSSITAEERFVQDVVPVSRWVMQAPGAIENRAYTPPTLNRDMSHRELTSDVVLIDAGPPLRWRVFRDVFEVNGKPVRDREARLQRLFTQPASTASAQSVRIAEESARFNLNLSRLERSINSPGIPIVFLQRLLQDRFAFSLDRRDRDNTWTVRYEESTRPTLFLHNRTMDNPSSGAIAIDAETGEVLRTEQTVTPPGFKVTVTTLFKRDERFGIAVPVEMREQIAAVPQGHYALEGAARYLNYRRFEVSTDEQAAAP